MTPILFLTTLLFIATIVHADIFSKALANILSIWLLPQPEESKYSNCHPANNRMRLFLSILIFWTPVLIFILSEPQSIIINEIMSQTILIFLIASTIILIYFNHSYIWSDDFRTVVNPMVYLKKSLKRNNQKQRNSEKEMSVIKEELTDKIYHTEEITKKIESKVITNSAAILEQSSLIEAKFILNRVYIKSLDEKLINTNTSIDRTNNNFKLKITETNELVKNINNNIFTLRCAEKKKLKNKIELENKPFKDYFRNQETFEKLNYLLLAKGFKATPTKICILIYKLVTLDVIIQNKKDKYYCQASARFFNLEKVDPGMYSNIKGTIQTSNRADNQNENRFYALIISR